MSVFTKRGTAIVPSNLPSPPDNYDKHYMQRLIAALDVALGRLTTGAAVNASTLMLPSLETAPTGLRANEVYLKTLASGEKVLSIVLPSGVW